MTDFFPSNENSNSFQILHEQKAKQELEDQRKEEEERRRKNLGRINDLMIHEKEKQIQEMKRRQLIKLQREKEEVGAQLFEIFVHFIP